MKTLTREVQAELTPEKAIELLADGNKRFVSNLKYNRNLLQQVNETSQGQHPFAIVLSCIDSRTSAELIFDQGLGDIFSARIAGNIVNEDILGSMEFACKVAGSKLIVVLGHTGCGAIKGACDDVKLGNLTGLLNKIKPAVADLRYDGDRSSANAAFVNMVAESNVHNAVKTIQNTSSIVREMIENKEIGIIGGMYNVETGTVEFYDRSLQKSQTPDEKLAG